MVIKSKDGDSLANILPCNVSCMYHKWKYRSSSSSSTLWRRTSIQQQGKVDQSEASALPSSSKQSWSYHRLLTKQFSFSHSVLTLYLSTNEETFKLYLLSHPIKYLPKIPVIELSSASLFLPPEVSAIESPQCLAISPETSAIELCSATFLLPGISVIESSQPIYIT